MNLKNLSHEVEYLTPARVLGDTEVSLTRIKEGVAAGRMIADVDDDTGDWYTYKALVALRDDRYVYINFQSHQTWGTEGEMLVSTDFTRLWQYGVGETDKILLRPGVEAWLKS